MGLQQRHDAMGRTMATRATHWRHRDSRTEISSTNEGIQRMQDEKLPLKIEAGDIPSREDWGDFTGDFDAADAFTAFFGKSNRQMQSEFAKNALMRAQDIRFMPGRPFSYYIKGLADFVRFGKHDADAPDIANSFISVIQDRVAADPLVLNPALSDINDALDFIASNNERFGRVPELYDDLSELAKHIKSLIQSQATS